MKVGDLVKYAGGTNISEWPCIVGLVVYVARSNKFEQTCDVLWGDGNTTHHNSRWLVQIQEIACK